MAQSSLEVLTSSVNALTGEIQGLRAETQELRVYGQRSRTLIWRQYLPIAAVVLLAVALGFVAYGARHTAQIANANAAHAASQCEQANNARAVTLNTWNTVLSADFTSSLPAAQQAQAKARLSDLKANLAKVLAPQDCSKIKP